MDRTESKHVFVIGLDDFNLAELQTVRNADEYEFHGLVDYDTMVHPPSYPMDAILAEARETLANAPAVDAIIGHWDFPTTSMLPILRREWGLPTPSLESVLYCENKYWNRLAGQEAVPECTPAFQGLDPYSDDPVGDLNMAYPFWLKPSVAFSSYLGFRIDDEQQYLQAMATIRDNIHVFAEPFDNILQYSANRAALPDHGSGATCIAEGLISGRLCTLEGYVHKGEVVVYAIVDSLRASNNVSFFSYQYPSHLPVGVRNRMISYADTILRHIGMDQSPFNMEFFWDEATDRLWLLEINPRISKSHCPIFQIATGASHHEVAIDIALGRKPNFPRNEGRFPIAGKFMPRVFGDTVVTRVPSREGIETLQKQHPELVVHVAVNEGDRLSTLRAQDSYSYEIADIFIGADSESALHDKFRHIMEVLDFRFSDVVPTNYN
ncbi:ATP-grasp domain-containing protein [Spiribacter vilamensis]|uniref:ATP-grasp domain-containing protein n=1 Tax=Spiribacter vilamensis TaxID=531306 RepID=A0A4Q8CYB0_9GAMM|nr:ATP-grasp domain-containing protein [Spiribacter vilamensis]RZU97870.1 ATP-grasp domain-containing protein [Spiribacter vilamensis]TVO61211.1 ATP-grasp domain-containing protein [Spiribacter vilamensis]